ncbi:MAG: YbjQ family protein [Rhodobacteraceae bacterium]|nr:YbjQ family protein [Paracoccaceae bacterium]
MLVSNLETAPGHRISAHLGIVQGSTVRAKHAGKDILAGLKNIVGGELKAYTDLMQEARAEAMAAAARAKSGLRKGSWTVFRSAGKTSLTPPVS